MDKFRKKFYNIKNHRNLYASEIREAEKNLTKLEESLQSFLTMIIMMKTKT